MALIALALLSGCGAERTSASIVSAATVTLDELPSGLGRGYPIALPIESNDTGIGIGDRAPNFRLTLDDGRTLTLHDLAGRPILINFWATWCGPCRIEMPEILRAARETPELVVLAVNVEEELEPIQAFAADFEMDVVIPRDQDGDVRTLYQVRGMPMSYFIDRNGVIRAVWAGVLTPSRLEELLNQIL
ncbi:MAG TPA: TlpA disulfide reductase family protein [Caldilineaceae bacterium]|nr:TlpA disulfide reductase family protein [Caldilineaceae bacterium]